MKTKLLSALCLMLLLTACSGSDENDSVGGNGNNTLHLSFKTPDWEQYINCDKLDLYGYPVNETTNYVSATSASTKETFYFSIPKDSSAMVAPGNLKRYAITEYGQNANPFEFSQKLPLTQGSDKYLVSSAGSSDDSYNEVMQITYIGNEGESALFKVKCSYKMQSFELGNETNVKSISGTFHFKVRTSRD
jgi:hypothetical protein